MNHLTLSYDAVTTHRGQPVTTSLQVAKYFGKRHKHVLRDIEEIWRSKPGQPDSVSQPKSGPPNSENEQNPDGDRPKSGPIYPNILTFTKQNFWLVEYTDTMNRKQEMYEMTKDGFTLLVMGYTGEKAMLFKIAYINAFNQMAATLREAETYFTRKAKAALHEKYPNMERVYYHYKSSSNNTERVARLLGISVGTVRANLRRNVHWGVLTEKELDNLRRYHREFQVALKKILDEQAAKIGGAA